MYEKAALSPTKSQEEDMPKKAKKSDEIRYKVSKIECGKKEDLVPII